VADKPRPSLQPAEVQSGEHSKARFEWLASEILGWSARPLPLLRQPFQGCDLAIKPSGEVHPPQGVDLLQRLFGLAVACVKRGQIDTVCGFSWVVCNSARKVNLCLHVIVQDVTLEISVRAIESRDRMRT
jgi:hypothetical protein